MSSLQCPESYIFNSETQLCEHSIFPLSISIIVGFVLIFFVSGFSSLAGAAGGTPHLVILMLLYNYTPKQSTIVIFGCILGTTLGNVLSQMRQKINNEPIIHYQYAFISIPLLFMGSIIGVLINNIFPSIIICSFVIYWTSMSLRKIYRKFAASYKKQTQQIENPQIDTTQKYIQTSFNPLKCPRNRYVFKNLACVFIAFIGISLLKGSQKFNSIIGIQGCSFLYWILYLVLFATMGFFSYYNLQILKKWESKVSLLDQESILTTPEEDNKIQQNIKLITKMSCLAGIFNGLGRGGGMFLIPMYKQLGLNAIQATATCSFSIFLGSLLNVIQGVLLGLIGLEDFLALFPISIIGSFVCSSIVPKHLQKINRVSLVELILLILLCVALVNLPISLYLKFVRSGYNTQLLFEFGKLC